MCGRHQRGPQCSLDNLDPSWSVCNYTQQGHPYPVCEGRSFQHGINFEGPRLTSSLLTEVWISTLGRSLFLFDWSSLLCGVFVFSFFYLLWKTSDSIYFFFLQMFPYAPWCLKYKSLTKSKAGHVKELCRNRQKLKISSFLEDPCFWFVSFVYPTSLCSSAYEV